MSGQRTVAMLFRLPIRSRLPTVLLSKPSSTFPSIISTSSLAHHYATVGRPRKVAGEPSQPARSAVKRRTSETKSKRSAPKKKQKTKTKAKSSSKKPKKDLTEEAKLKLKKRDDQRQISDLKKAALKPPRRSPATPYLEFAGPELKKAFSTSSTDEHSTAEHAKRFGQISREISSRWKNLSPSEIEHYNHLANTATQTINAEYKQWVESHSIEEIARANHARLKLRHKFDKVSKQRSYLWLPIHDERRTKQPASSFILFYVSRTKSGDFRNIPVVERSKLAGQEWRALSDSEKQKYKDIAVRERNDVSHGLESHDRQTLAAAA